MAEVKKWMGGLPPTCNICDAFIKHQDFFIDGRIKGTTSWGIMCTWCHTMFGIGLGQGHGQKYDVQTLEKVEG